MLAGSSFSQGVATAARMQAVPAFGYVAAAILAVLALFASTTTAMVEIWYRSETYSHGFLVIPAVLWLIWRRREVLAATPINPLWPGLIGLAGVGLAWLLAELAGTAAPAQFALIALVVLSVLTVFGWRWARELAFPLSFLFFAVPFGEAFVPILIDWTADFTVAALRASGVPVYREGTHFVIPTGQWSVVEACSGIRYLIASAVTGSLYAWLMYRSMRRRVVFIAAALVFPILANWIRAYGIVMLGHLSQNRLATGIDHLVYGWIFFGVVMFILFVVGARWREDAADEPPAVQSAAVARTFHPSRALVAAAAVGALLLAVWPLAYAGLAAPRSSPAIGAISIQAVNGWVPTTSIAAWNPSTHRPSATQTAWFTKDGQVVGVFIALYRDQQNGAELVNSQNLLVHEKDALWREVERKNGAVATLAGALPYRGALLRAAELRLAVWHWYWLGGRTTASNVVAKIDLALDRLLRRDDTSAWVIVFTPVDGSLNAAEPALSAFVRDMDASIDAALHQVRR